VTEPKTVFENEEAARLLNYFISYKEIVNKTKNHPNGGSNTLIISVLPKKDLPALK
jgi:hypothetical protein